MKIGYRVAAVMFSPNGTVTDHQVFAEGFLKKDGTVWGERRFVLPGTRPEVSAEVLAVTAPMRVRYCLVQPLSLAVLDCRAAKSLQCTMES